MQQIRVTKEFSFEAAHALHGHDGPCRHIHGHSYTLSVTVSGFAETNPESPKLGMVIDFSDLKRIVKREIIDQFDHSLILNGMKSSGKEQNGHEGNIILLPYQPTSENMLSDFMERLRRSLPEGLRLVSMRLRETATSYAEWFASDNPEISDPD